jgi:hypothetical protein
LRVPGEPVQDAFLPLTALPAFGDRKLADPVRFLTDRATNRETPRNSWTGCPRNRCYIKEISLNSALRTLTRSDCYRSVPNLDVIAPRAVLDLPCRKGDSTINMDTADTRTTPSQQAAGKPGLWSFRRSARSKWAETAGTGESLRPGVLPDDFCHGGKFPCYYQRAYASKRTLLRTYRFASYAADVMLCSSLS